MVKVLVKLIGQHAPIKAPSIDKKADYHDLLMFSEFVDECLPDRIVRNIRERSNQFVELSNKEFIDRYRLSENAISKLLEYTGLYLTSIAVDFFRRPQ
jgi:hypothetical protein